MATPRANTRHTPHGRSPAIQLPRSFELGVLSVVVLSLALLASADPGKCVPDSIGAVEDSARSNPFSGFETHYLPNGLKIWIKYLPEDPNVSISVTTPYGWDHDPPGMEELAHFTEHMLFSDHMGRTEEEIKREVEDLGGYRNGITHCDHTYYYVDIAKAHGLFAVDWLFRLVSPHEMPPDIVERQRGPIAVELKARPRDLVDWIEACYINPPLLRLPDSWEREFGLVTRSSRDYYPHRSLHAIRAEDLRWFYDTYYPPGAMILTIVGDFDPDALWATIDTTFSRLPERPLPDVTQNLRDPMRRRLTYDWDVRATVTYGHWFKFYSIDSQEQQMLLFVRDWLQRRLQRRLRYGDRKATYGIRVRVFQRGLATYLRISGDIKESEIDHARSVIEEELEILRRGEMPAEEFCAERDALVRRLYMRYVEAKDLTGSVRAYFYDRSLHEDFPDLVGFYNSRTQEQLSVFSRASLVPEHEVQRIVYPQRISQGIMIGALLVIIWLALCLARKILILPVDMTRIRYVARFRIPFLYHGFILTILIAVLSLLARLGYFGYMVLWSRVLSGIDSFWIQYAFHGLALMVGASLLFVVLGQIPRKILVFEDELRIKNLLYGSRKIDLDRIEEISLRRGPEVWFSRRILGCWPLTLGILSPGLYLRIRGGGSWFFRVRCTEELRDLIADVVE